MSRQTNHILCLSTSSRPSASTARALPLNRKHPIRNSSISTSPPASRSFVASCDCLVLHPERRGVWFACTVLRHFPQVQQERPRSQQLEERPCIPDIKAQAFKIFTNLWRFDRLLKPRQGLNSIDLRIPAFCPEETLLLTYQCPIQSE